MTTLNEIKQTKSYEPLRRNGLSDENILQFHSLPNGQRAVFLNSFKREKVEIKPPKSEVKSLGTQKCTEVTIGAIRRMALEHMSKDYYYRGRLFNPNAGGWKFEFNDRKAALGLCSYRNRTIYLSTFFINQGSREMKMWVNTMVHEIAHAFSGTVFNSHGHSNLWRNMFISFGGNGNRCSGDTEFGNLIENPVSKYTLVCDNCGTQKPSHRIKKRASACSKCCKKYNGGRYSVKYKLRQVQNY